MNVTEFVTKVIKDKNFMFEVFTHVPDEMLGENGVAKEGDQGQLGRVLGRYCWPGAQTMGCTFTEDELVAESDRQVSAIRGFGKAKFFVRMIKTLAKAKPQKK